MLDRERILSKLDEIDGHVRELRQIAPVTPDQYRQVEKRRACERLLQIAIEGVIDVCGLMVAGLRLGLPGEEDDLFEKLARAGLISSSLRERLRRMKGLRNILVHEYGRVDDGIVLDVIQNRLADFEEFRREAVQALTGQTGS